MEPSYTKVVLIIVFGFSAVMALAVSQFTGAVNVVITNTDVSNIFTMIAAITGVIIIKLVGKKLKSLVPIKKNPNNGNQRR